MNGWRRFLPGRISGQIAVLVLLAIGGIHVILSILFAIARPEMDDPAFPEESLAALVRTYATLPEGESRARFIEAAPMLSHGAAMRQAPAGTTGTSTPPARRFAMLLGLQGADVRDLAPHGDPASLAFLVTLPDGDAVTVSRRAAPAHIVGPLLVTIVFFAVSVMILAGWAARALTKPLTAFAEAASAFDIAGDAPPLPERGPEEVRVAAIAFNAMRLRIRRLVEERTRMLAAVGHDLRTPITRLRLRAEFIEDAGARVQTMADLDQMGRMVDSALASLRGGAEREAPSRIDLAATLQTICDQHGDAGGTAVYVGPDHASIVARPDDIHRAVDNLVRNAIVHGGGATVRLAGNARTVTVDVEDDGPGIADDEKATMLAPFARGEAARTMGETSGFGLGLSIAVAIIEEHGGRLELLNRHPRGLIARIELPAG